MYDLAIIGAGPEGAEAARQALAFPSRRVVWVSQGFPVSPTLNPQIYEQLWRKWLKFRSLSLQLDYPPQSLTKLHRRFQNLSSGLGASPLEPLQRLALEGIDLIWGEGRFLEERPLTFQVNQRRFQAKHYLLTSLPPVVTSGRLEHLDQLPFYTEPLTGDRWVLRGGTPEHIVWAEILASLGKIVHVITHNAHLLPEEDPEMAHLLQAYLESLGVVIWTKVQGVQQRLQGDEICLNLDSVSLTADYYLTPPPLPQAKLWMPESPLIHPCGAWSPGYSDSALFCREAREKVNQIFGQAKPLDYAQMPFTLDTGVLWSRVGYPPARLPFPPQVEYQIHQNELMSQTQMLKFFLHPRSQKILGAYAWGTAPPPACLGCVYRSSRALRGTEGPPSIFVPQWLRKLRPYPLN
ncbi:MAG: NAD-binding protein [Cyanobacteriota bacterium]|jgi:pyruvate/2-oxoglutarate dehydrogenase complex dihydrolipoamide dehydrogenase (E3) component